MSFASERQCNLACMAIVDRADSLRGVWTPDGPTDEAHVLREGEHVEGRFPTGATLVLLGVAFDLFNGGGNATIADLQRLDQGNMMAVATLLGAWCRGPGDVDDWLRRQAAAPPDAVEGEWWLQLMVAALTRFPEQPCRGELVVWQDGSFQAAIEHVLPAGAGYVRALGEGGTPIGAMKDLMAMTPERVEYRRHEEHARRADADLVDKVAKAFAEITTRDEFVDTLDQLDEAFVHVLGEHVRGAAKGALS